MLEIGASAKLGYGRVWWAGEDLNLQARRAARLQRVGVTRHRSCPTIGAPGRTLTPDPLVRSQPLCTLSYGSVVLDRRFELRLGGLSARRLCQVGLVQHGARSRIRTETVPLLRRLPLPLG